MYPQDPHAPSHPHAPPQPPLPHLQQQQPSSSAAYASLSSSSSNQPYAPPPPPTQSPSIGYPNEPYPTTYQQQHHAPYQQQHYQHPPPQQQHQQQQQHHLQPHQQHLTGAYPHHSRYLKIHSFSPSSSPPPPYHPPTDLYVNCTLFPTLKNNSNLDPSHPPAKTIRLCFGSLPLATKVARAPGSAPADAGGQDLLLSCRVPTWENVQAGLPGGKPGMGGGRVGVHVEILGASAGGGEERVLERVWFGEFEFLGVNGTGGSGEEEEMSGGMEVVGGWGGQGRAATHQPTMSQKRAGSPLLAHSPRRRQSPGLGGRHEMDPYEYQQEFNVVGDPSQNSPYLQVDMQRPPMGSGSYSYHSEPPRTYSPSPLVSHHGPPPPNSSQSYVSPQPGHSSPHFWAPPPPPPPPHPSSSSRPTGGVPPPIVPPSPNQPLTINPQNLSPTTPPNAHSAHPGSESTPLMVRTFQLPRTPKAQRATPTSAGGATVKVESPGMVTRAVDGRDTHGVQAGSGGKGGTTKASLLLQGDLGQMAIGW
ncbi:hypothetical protein BDY24DRAFT_230074 [Mrakia frigida]|uniref:uncharacterized protein n=1 Tax=Mrakia frigida TaxID=29902 RepID=UPI003FCC12D9